MSVYAPPLQRVVLSFSVDHLPVREELLLKSLMRVLDHRTRHEWRCVNQDQDADLRVTGLSHEAVRSSAAVIFVGHHDEADLPAGASQLKLPLRAPQVEAVFNHMGGLLETWRAEAAASAAFAAGTPVRLRRWPAASLLNSAERINLATLLSVRACTAQELHRRSGASVQACLAFLADLHRAGLLEEERRVQAAVPMAAGARPGLLARIRARLGLQAAAVQG